MIPKRIELENFLSFGTPASEFTFGDDEPLWVLCGRNGVGKSAIFDAITYALYGEHRGGGQKAEQLIRHGANGFRIVFEFQFAGIDYRITRTRTGKTTQKVEHLTDGVWNTVVGVNSPAQVKEWVEKLLGLVFKAFTTSVLLRQGEADKLFAASRDDRITLLKGIIAFERFEEISNRVHVAATAKKNACETLQRQKDASVIVTPEELSTAEQAVTETEQRREQAHLELTAAAQVIEQAKQWEALEAKRLDLEQHLADAATRAKDATTIRAAKARLDDLATAVPLLEALLSLQSKIETLQPRLADAQDGQKRTTEAIASKVTATDEARQKADQHKEVATEFDQRAKTLGEEIERGTKFLQLADVVAALKNRLDEYPADLTERITLAEAEEKDAGNTKQQASNAVAAAKSRLEQSVEQKERFSDVEVGVTCSQCGQLVTAAHAEKELARLANEIRTRTSEVSQYETESNAAVAKLTAMYQRRVALQKQNTERDNVAGEFSIKNTSLKEFGGVANAAELRTRLEEQHTEKTRIEACAKEEKAKQAAYITSAKRLEGERMILEGELKALNGEVRQHEASFTLSRAQREAKMEQLTPDWRSRFPALDNPAVADLAVERNQLRDGNGAARFELLRKDDAMRDEWTAQLCGVHIDLDGIPADARLCVKDAQQRQSEAKSAAVTANNTRDTAIRVRDELKSRAEACERLTTRLRVVEREHRLHAKLDELLGRNKLQRELVRDAEQQIVELANDTLQNLSDGDLSLEADDEATGRDDKAFALRVRRVGDAIPIGIAFLSGSQKFRVAVAVALAVGRFASGRSRPLEAVIIDEGFGSLDKEGLRAMAEELKRLQRSQSLARIVLVSHQDEFTGQFPVGYRLESGENGTTAKPIRNP